jgi:hypothetical protein
MTKAPTIMARLMAERMIEGIDSRTRWATVKGGPGTPRPEWSSMRAITVKRAKKGKRRMPAAAQSW